FVATLIGGGLEMRSLAAVGGPKIGIISRRRRSGRPPGNRPAMLFVCGNADRWRPGGLRSLAAVAGRKLASFHGADGADALQGIGQQCSSFVATLIGGGLEGCGPSQPSPAENWHRFTAPTERTPSRESASNALRLWQR